MSCPQTKMAISALLDGEEPGIDEASLSAHLERCGSCRSYASHARTLHRALRLQAAPRVPDLTATILQSLEPAVRDERVLALRICLVVVGLAQLGVAAPALLLGSESGLSTHAARHAGAFAIALAIGFLVAAWRSVHTAGILAVTAVVVICLVGAALADVAAGRTGTVAELGHTPELVGLVALWLLQRHQPRLIPAVMS